MKNIVIIDVETSGVNPFNHQLLSVAIAPLDSSIPPKSFYIRHKNIYWSQWAKRNFLKFEKDWLEYAVEPEIAANQIEEYLEENFNGELVTIAGQNVGFDMAYLRQLAFLTNRQDIKYIDHRSIDTHSLLFALSEMHVISEKSLSSTAAFKLFSIDPEENERHTAMGDALATKVLLKHILKLFKKSDTNIRAKDRISQFWRKKKKGIVDQVKDDANLDVLAIK